MGISGDLIRLLPVLINRFSGLISRCTMFCWWQNATALMSWQMYCRT